VAGLERNIIMSQITAETLFHQITSLPFSEMVKLRALLDDQLQNPEVETNRVKLVKRVLAALRRRS
jgi:hypothetical protein